MKKILLPLILLLAGLGVGGGAAYGTSRLLGPRPATSGHEAVDTGEMGFATSTKITAPLVLPDGRLSGYVAFEVSLQVPLDKSADVGARMPLFLHAVNMRTYRTPMAAGPDGLLPDLGTFRKVVMEASDEAFGPHVVHFAAITQALPA